MLRCYDGKVLRYCGSAVLQSKDGAAVMQCCGAAVTKWCCRVAVLQCCGCKKGLTLFLMYSVTLGATPMFTMYFSFLTISCRRRGIYRSLTLFFR